jgi:hypothetical protein
MFGKKRLDQLESVSGIRHNLWETGEVTIYLAKTMLASPISCRADAVRRLAFLIMLLSLIPYFGLAAADYVYIGVLILFGAMLVGLLMHRWVRRKYDAENEVYQANILASALGDLEPEPEPERTALQQTR